MVGGEDRAMTRIRDYPPGDRPPKVLSPMALRFVNEMIAGELPQEQCALRAGYAASYAAGAACSLMTDPAVVRAIEDGRRQIRAILVERTAIDLAEVVTILAKLARFDIGELVDENGAPRPLRDIPPDARLALEGIDIETIFSGRGDEKQAIGTLTRYKVAKRTVSLDMLMRHFGGYEKDNQQAAQPIIELLQQVRARNSGSNTLRITDD